jgi:hypothetical protein
MCIGQQPSPKELPSAPPSPEEPPKAPIIPESRPSAANRQGRDSLRINLNPGLIL